MDDQPEATESVPEGAAPAEPESGQQPASGRAAAPEAPPDGNPDPGPRAGAAATDELLQAVRGLRERFDDEIAGNDLQRNAFDALHAELQGYRESFLNELHKPVIQNLVRLYDSFLRLEETLPAAGGRQAGPSVEEFSGRLGDFIHNMKNFRVELTEVLARLDVETYEDRHGVDETERLRKLDRKLHRPVKVETTPEADRNNEVLQVHKRGFYWRGRVLRPADVTILRHQPAATGDGGDDG